MRILDRYILRTIVIIFLAALCVFCLLFVLIDSASNLDEFINQQIPMSVLLQYYLSYLPFVLTLTGPIACLIAVLLTFSNLNSHNEVIVLRASGMNFWQITKPALCFAVIVSAFVFVINERFVPTAEERTRQLKTEYIHTSPEKSKKKKPVIKNLTFYGLKNRLYFIDSFDPNTNELDGVTIIEYDNTQNIKEKVVALKGKWTGINWKFFQCHVTEFSQSADVATKVKVYEEKLVDIKETPEDFLNQRLNVNSMNIKQLREYIERFANSGAVRAINNLRVDFHYKIAFPFSTIVIVLLGLPLALMTGRRRAQTFTSLGIAVAIGFLFYVCNSVGIAFGKGAVFPPIIAAWFTPALFTFAGLWLIQSKFE